MTQQRSFSVAPQGILDRELELPAKLQKTRITAQRIEPGFDGQNQQRPVLFLICLLQIPERLVVFLQCNMNDREIVSRDPARSGSFLEAAENCPRTGCPPRGGKTISQFG